MWHSRGYLPHFNQTGKQQHVTVHLGDSLPKAEWAAFQVELALLPEEQRALEKYKKVQEWLDAGYGSCILRRPEIARLVEETLQFFNGQRYSITSWCVMPNHFHVLFATRSGWTLRKVVASWKKFTARQICTISPDQPRPVWHEEYWDRFMRDEDHFQNTISYIHENPVKAGLCNSTEEWLWSSAWPAHAHSPTDGRRDEPSSDRDSR